MRRITYEMQRLVGVFLAGLFLLFSPVISLFDRPVLLFGVPLLYAYLFGVWALLIVITAWVVGGRSE